MVRAGIVKHPADSPWSSYHYNAQGKEDPLVTPHSLYRRLDRNADTRRSAYRQLFRGQLSKADVEAIRETTNKAWVLGNGRFREKIEALSGRRAKKKLRGRPPKNGYLNRV